MLKGSTSPVSTVKDDEYIRSGADFLTPRPKTAKEKAEALAALAEEEKRLTRCCFTGHRPDGLRRPVDDIKVDLENEIVASITAGYHTFITGMAPGIDLWAGCIVLRLKDRFPDIRLIAAVPYKSFREYAAVASGDWLEKYDRILSGADLVQTISSSTDVVDLRLALQTRNNWMVDHSNKVIAVWNWKPSGTGNTVRYAKGLKREIKYIRA